MHFYVHVRSCPSWPPDRNEIVSNSNAMTTDFTRPVRSTTTFGKDDPVLPTVDCCYCRCHGSQSVRVAQQLPDILSTIATTSQEHYSLTNVRLIDQTSLLELILSCSTALASSKITVEFIKRRRISIIIVLTTSFARISRQHDFAFLECKFFIDSHDLWSNISMRSSTLILGILENSILTRNC